MALKIRKHQYYVTRWVWSKVQSEYFPQTVFQTNFLDDATRVFNEIPTNIDVPLVELWETGEDVHNRLDYKEV